MNYTIISQSFQATQMRTSTRILRRAVTKPELGKARRLSPQVTPQTWNQQTLPSMISVNPFLTSHFIPAIFKIYQPNKAFRFETYINTRTSLFSASSSMLCFLTSFILRKSKKICLKSQLPPLKVTASLKKAY